MNPSYIDFAEFFLKRLKTRVLSENDLCRMAVYWVQGGRDYVTGVPLKRGERELHHRQPRYYGGIDAPGNLILLHRTVHAMVHAETFEKFYMLLEQMPLTAHQLNMVNMLRYEANRAEVPPQTK